MSGRALRRTWAWVAAVAAFVLVPAVGASAHATLVETSPADGERLAAPPDEVVVRFDEGVDVPTGAVRVFSASEARVDAGDAGQGSGPEEITVSLRPDLSDGVYVVTWRAVSLDGHPVRGAFVFEVGDGTVAVDESLVADLLGESASVPWAVAGAVSRWMTYLAGLAAVGGLAFQRLVLGGDGRSARLTASVRAAAVAGGLAGLVQIPLFAAEATGLGMTGLVSGPALADAAASPIGVAAWVRVTALALVWVAAGVERGSVWAWSGWTGVVVAELLAGHTMTTEPRWLVLASDAVHVMAAALWAGGLAALALSFRRARRDDDPQAAAGMLGRFSTLATWSLGGLTLAGLALAWTQVRAPRALTTTAYGWTLVAKVALAAVVMGVGAYNNRRLVPAIVTGQPQAGGSSRGTVDLVTRTDAWARIRRTVRIELAVLAGVLAVTAVLVNLRPAAEAAGISGPFSTYLDFGDGQVNVVVDPNRAGDNQIHVYTLSAAGAPVAAEGQATLELSLPESEVGPIVREPQVAGPGHWVHTGPELALPGTWEITFRLGSRFDEQSATATVAVQP